MNLVSCIHFFFLTLLFSLVFFIAITNISSYCVASLIFLYILIAILCLQINLEILTLLLILIYSGGVLVLFFFCLFFLESNKDLQPTVSNIKVTVTIYSLIVLIFIVIVIFFSFFNNFFVNYYKIYSLFITSKNKLVLLQSIISIYYNENCFENLNNDLLVLIGINLYLVYFVANLLSFLLLFSILILIVIVSNKFNINTKKSTYFLNFLEIMWMFSNVFNFVGYSEIFIIEFINVGIFLIFVILFIFFVHFKKEFNFFRFLIFMELLLIPIIILISIFSVMWGVIDGFIFVMLLLNIFASETALGLSLFYNKSFKKIKFKSKNVIK